MTVPPAGQPATGGVPLTFSRTAAVQVGLQPRLTIEIEGTSVFADASANVKREAAVARVRRRHRAGEARDRVDRGGDVRVLIARPPFPSTAELLPPIWIWNEWPAFAALNPVRATCCCSLPPCSAAAMPAAVLFWPRVIGTVSAPP